jgi:hypothetical protein
MKNKNKKKRRRRRRTRFIHASEIKKEAKCFVENCSMKNEVYLYRD